MNAANRTVILKKYLEDVINVLDSKGKAYSGTDNVNANIESTAKSLKITKYQVWSVFFKKHIDCIFNSIADNPEEPQDNTESLDGRITDAINYLLILKTILIDDNLAGGFVSPNYVADEYANKLVFSTSGVTYNGRFIDEDELADIIHTFNTGLSSEVSIQVVFPGYNKMFSFNYNKPEKSNELDEDELDECDINDNGLNISYVLKKGGKAIKRL